jgi:NAD-dependent dihydropyrimidine dehydrogenase PreA subunit
MKMKYLKNVVTLRLDQELCGGCGRCLEVCPHGVFKMEAGKAAIAMRDACMECGACARNCLPHAIFLKNGVGCAAGLLNAKLGLDSSCCGENQSCCCSCKTEDEK